MIKQADKSDIKAIEEILLNAVTWLKDKDLANQWNETNIKWSALSKSYKINDFYICYKDGHPAGCMAITDLDMTYWPEIPAKNSLYLHKLAVKRKFAGKGISKQLISFAKNLASSNNMNSVRLDCNFYRTKLRQVYENEGFIYIDSKTIKDNSPMALYAWSKN